MKKLIYLIVLIMLSSCGNVITKYTITDYNKREYYTNQFVITNKCITFAEYSRNKLRDSITICGLYSVNTNINHLNINKDCKAYIKELKEIGYSNEWAIHKALVEFKYISIDKEYLAIEED